ncbi:MAG: helix-turn-helix transcriptional regulator [Pseudomonadota bacterium]
MSADGASGLEDASLNDEAHRFAAAAGEKIRSAREAAGLSRRALAETSGVSQRYLAQVETGRGNISISLLFKIGRALDKSLDHLIGGASALDEEAIQAAALFQRADATTRLKALKVLADGPSPVRKASRIALIGLRGAGKSTLGAAVAAKLGLPFVELNREVAADTGMAISDVLALYGVEGYRKLENAALARASSDYDAMILAVSGGVVSAPESYAALLSRFHTIWLKAPPEDHMDRVRAQGDERPMAGNPTAMRELRSILRARAPLYERADIELDTAGRTAAESADDLADLIKMRELIT